MKETIRRGLYDHLSGNNEWSWIYNYYKQAYLGNAPSSDQIVNESKKRESSIQLDWMYCKAIVNKAIRENNSDIAEEYIQRLRKISTNKFDYINSYSFYLMKFISKEAAREYIESSCDINSYLSKSSNYWESLLMKNYSSLLTYDNPLRKRIMEKCCQETPQDVDLWMDYLDSYADKKTIQIKKNEIFANGYSDLKVAKDIVITNNESDIVRVILLLSSSGINRELSNDLIKYITNTRLKTFLKRIIQNTELRYYMEGSVDI